MRLFCFSQLTLDGLSRYPSQSRIGEKKFVSTLRARTNRSTSGRIDPFRFSTFPPLFLFVNQPQQIRVAPTRLTHCSNPVHTGFAPNQTRH
jgi:hypothetical protein